MTISKILDVSDAPPIKNQSVVMMKELDAALKSDITDQSLPLLLHNVRKLCSISIYAICLAISGKFIKV